MLFNLSNIRTDYLEHKLFAKKELSVSVVRLDQLHPIVSGNKLFKLHYFLETCKSSAHQTILTFGGAYSNHLIATAFACKCCRLRSIGIVRGEKSAALSHTLQQCQENGMKLVFLSRQEYAERNNENFTKQLLQRFGSCTIIPEGGFHADGARGASLIMQTVRKNSTHICCAEGTGTTLAGLLMQAAPHQQIVSVQVLKGITGTYKNISFLTEGRANLAQLRILDQYHWGGYAKQAPELIAFMNDIYRQFHIPTDFVYTAKMLYAVFDMVDKDGFPPGSHITCLHTGGLQGNLSLPPGTLLY